MDFGLKESPDAFKQWLAEPSDAHEDGMDSRYSFKFEIDGLLNDQEVFAVFR